MRSIGEGVAVTLAAVGICCGVPLVLAAVAAGTLGLGLAGIRLVAVGAALALSGVALLAIRHARRRRADA